VGWDLWSGHQLGAWGSGGSKGLGDCERGLKAEDGGLKAVSGGDGVLGDGAASLLITSREGDGVLDRDGAASHLAHQP